MVHERNATILQIVSNCPSSAIRSRDDELLFKTIAECVTTITANTTTTNSDIKVTDASTSTRWADDDDFINDPGVMDVWKFLVDACSKDSPRSPIADQVAKEIECAHKTFITAAIEALEKWLLCLIVNKPSVKNKVISETNGVYLTTVFQCWVKGQLQHVNKGVRPTLDDISKHAAICYLPLDTYYNLVFLTIANDVREEAFKKNRDIIKARSKYSGQLKEYNRALECVRMLQAADPSVKLDIMPTEPVPPPELTDIIFEKIFLECFDRHGSYIAGEKATFKNERKDLQFFEMPLNNEGYVESNGCIKDRERRRRKKEYIKEYLKGLGLAVNIDTFLSVSSTRMQEVYFPEDYEHDLPHMSFTSSSSSSSSTFSSSGSDGEEEEEEGRGKGRENEEENRIEPDHGCTVILGKGEVVGKLIPDDLAVPDEKDDIRAFSLTHPFYFSMMCSAIMGTLCNDHVVKKCFVEHFYEHMISLQPLQSSPFDLSGIQSGNDGGDDGKTKEKQEDEAIEAKKLELQELYVNIARMGFIHIPRKDHRPFIKRIHRSLKVQLSLALESNQRLPSPETNTSHDLPRNIDYTKRKVDWYAKNDWITPLVRDLVKVTFGEDRHQSGYDVLSKILGPSDGEAETFVQKLRQTTAQGEQSSLTSPSVQSDKTNEKLTLLVECPEEERAPQRLADPSGVAPDGTGDSCHIFDMWTMCELYEGPFKAKCPFVRENNEGGDDGTTVGTPGFITDPPVLDSSTATTTTTTMTAS